MIINNNKYMCHEVMPSEALGPGSVLVISRRDSCERKPERRADDDDDDETDLYSASL